MSNYAGNTVIVTITESHSVPAGEYCADRTVEPSYQCKLLANHTINMGWSDGMGSPGKHTLYTCSLFREPITQIYASYEERTAGIKGFRFLKCERCAQQGKQTAR